MSSQPFPYTDVGYDASLNGPNRVAGMPRLRGESVKTVMYHGNPPPSATSPGTHIGAGTDARHDLSSNHGSPKPLYLHQDEYQQHWAQQHVGDGGALPAVPYASQYGASEDRYGANPRDFSGPTTEPHKPSSSSTSYGYYPPDDGNDGAIGGGTGPEIPPLIQRPKIAANSRPRALPSGNGGDAPQRSIHDRLMELQAAENAIRARLAVQDSRPRHPPQSDFKQQQQLPFSSAPQRPVDGAAPAPGEWAPAPPGLDEGAPFGTDRNAKVRYYGDGDKISDLGAVVTREFVTI